MLVDVRQQHTLLDTVEIYSFWQELAPRVARGAKLAVLVGWQFIENGAVNRGVNIRYINDMDKALTWLTGLHELTPAL